MMRILLLLSAFIAVLFVSGTAFAADDAASFAMLPAGVSDEGYHFTKTVSGDFTSAVEQLRAELKTAGFGVLTEIDFAAKMKEKLNQDISPYLILGACHPPLAYEVYQLEPWVGELMPCNFVVREMPEGGVMVSVKNPGMLTQATGNDALTEISAELTGKVLAVLDKLT